MVVREGGPTAIVSGGASGIGRALCGVLSSAGWRIAIGDRDAAGARAVAAACGGSGFALDVCDETSVSEFFERAVASLGGRLDGLATSAGRIDMTPFLELSVPVFRRLYDVNVIGTYLCIREAVKYMSPGARICTVASVAGKRGGGLSGTAAYAASKGGVLALSRNAARSLAEYGIAVNCVAPGATSTPMTASAFPDAAAHRRVAGLTVLGRVAEPHEIAEAIAWLLSPQSSYVDGETLTVDGGMMMD